MTHAVTKIAPGQVVATPPACVALATAGQTPHDLLARHIRGDWSDVGRADAAVNDASVGDGWPHLSVRVLSTGGTLSVIQEAVGDDD
jgi:hypothetical protein